MTATQLIASAYRNPCKGPNHCFFCGAPCGTEYPAEKTVKDSFAAHSATHAFRTANRPPEWFVCNGCIIAMRTDVPRAGYDKPQRWWTFSHVVTSTSDEFYTKAHLARLAEICLSPPQSPYAIILADSGQKHQAYLAPVNAGGEEISVMLECEVVSYRSSQLAAALDLCACIAVAAGKPTLDESSSVSMGIALSAYWADWESILDQWDAAYGSPLYRLAAWLTPGKETLGKDSRYVSDIVTTPDANVRRARVPTTARGTVGPKQIAGQPGLFG